DALYLPYSVYPLIDGYTEFSDTALGHHEQRVKAHEDKCRAVLENYRTQAQAQGVEAEIKLMTGEPGHAICDMVKEWRGDLILLGNRGLRGLKELVLGSVSSFVMHHAHCSVLILRDVQLQPSDQEKAPSEERKSCAVGSPH
ncbi:MAG: universal stress protein, partial [Cyanobacteria bacterium P01_F01_bin.42]